jgi:hypothetical protein
LIEKLFNWLQRLFNWSKNYLIDCKDYLFDRKTLYIILFVLEKRKLFKNGDFWGSSGRRQLAVRRVFFDLAEQLNLLNIATTRRNKNNLDNKHNKFNFRNSI